MATSDFALLTVENTGGVLALKRKGAAEVVPESASPLIGAVSGGAAVIPDSAAERVLRSVKVNVEPAQSGYGDPSPDNVRSISGWTAAKVTRCGKNLLDSDSAGYINGITYRWKKGVVPNGVTAIMSFHDKDTTVDISDVFIGFSANDLSTQSLLTKYRWCMQNGVIASDRTNKDRSDNTTICSNVVIYPKTDDAFNRLFARYDIQVEVGIEATDFEPYVGDVFGISFPSDAGTVYGGTLDVTAGTLTVEWYHLNVEEFTSAYDAPKTSSGKVFSKSIGNVGNTSPRGVASSANNITIICNRFICHGLVVADGECYVTNKGFTLVFAIPDASVNTLELANAWLADNPTQVVYQLAHPVVYQLTPRQIAALAGINTVFADCGPVSVEYVRDTEAVIEASDASTRAMIGEASGTTASRSLAVGEYVTVGDKLYRVTSAVGSGETLVPGTNVTETTVGAELARIAAMIS